MSTQRVSPQLEVQPALSNDTEAVTPLAQRAFTGPRGGEISYLKDELLRRALHGVTSARVILFDPEDPSRVVMRRGKNGRFGPLGGQLEPSQHPVHCVLAEVWQEGRIRRVPDLALLTVLLHENRGVWLGREAWESWGYSTRGYETTKGRVRVANLKTAIFAAPLTEAVRTRHIEDRTVTVLDLDDRGDRSKVRPLYQHLFELWRARQHGMREIPSLIRYTRD